MLATDPWLLGSVYWRSWWLQHYPSAEEIDWVAKSPAVYVTHEHPDHFHMPTIRRLGPAPVYLFPALAERGYLDYMRQRGYRAEIVVPLRWRAIAGDVSILSIPIWCDDSLLLVDTPTALILNLNDAKPLPPVVAAIRRVADRIGQAEGAVVQLLAGQRRQQLCRRGRDRLAEAGAALRRLRLPTVRRARSRFLHAVCQPSRVPSRRQLLGRTATGRPIGISSNIGGPTPGYCRPTPTSISPTLPTDRHSPEEVPAYGTARLAVANRQSRCRRGGQPKSRRRTSPACNAS